MQEKFEIKKIIKDFYNISGIRISIFDTEFNEIDSFPKESTTFCKHIQNFSCAKQKCISCDRKAFTQAEKTGEPYIYRCHMGLFEVVVPLYSFGILSGYLMMGQFTDTDILSNENIIRKTKAFVNDIDESKKLFSQITSIDRNLVNSYISIMTLIGEYLTSTNRAISYNTDLPFLIKEYLNRNYASKITLETLSKKFGYCNVTLTKSFKKAFDITILDYLTSVRLKKAVELITKSQIPFKNIATSCGFKDQNYFSKSFTKHFGISPTEFRLRNSKDNNTI